MPKFRSEEPKDPRSTGRKRARKSLFEARVLYRCQVCHRTTKEAPPDAPPWFADIWPTEKRELKSTYSLQADHENKNVLDNDPANLSWLCSSCHKVEDSKTAKGVSRIGDEFGYGLDL